MLFKIQAFKVGEGLKSSPPQKKKKKSGLNRVKMITWDTPSTCMVYSSVLKNKRRKVKLYRPHIAKTSIWISELLNCSYTPKRSAKPPCQCKIGVSQSPFNYRKYTCKLERKREGTSQFCTLFILFNRAPAHSSVTLQVKTDRTGKD